jgi:signal transduction histidine kinase
MPLRVVIAAGDASDAAAIGRAVSNAFGAAEQAHVHIRDAWTRTLSGAAADLVIATLPLAWLGPEEFFRGLQDRWPGVPVIVVTESDGGIRDGAFDVGLTALLRTTPDGLDGVLGVIGAVARDAQSAGADGVLRQSYAAPSVSAPAPDADRHAQRQRCQAEKMDALARLAGGVAHEFNNFLMVVIGYTDMLASRTSATEEPCQEIEDIRDLCRDATMLTQQLLTFGRRQARQLVVLDVSQIVAELERPLRQALGGDVTLKVILANGPALVRADQRRLEQVFMTLAARARNAMPSGGAVTIEVDGSRPAGACDGSGSIAEPQAWVTVCVTDAGPGIDADAVDQFFEPSFSKTREGRRHGPDLALANAYAIIRQSDGRMAVTSAPGAPTTVTIALPRVLEAPAPA